MYFYYSMYDITIITNHIEKNIKAIKAPSPLDLMGLVLCLVITFSNVVCVSISVTNIRNFLHTAKHFFIFFYLVETIFILSCFLVSFSCYKYNQFSNKIQTFFLYCGNFIFVSSFIPYYCFKELYKYSQFSHKDQTFFLFCW